MTYHNYEWTAFTEADLLATATGDKSWTINKGDTFTMPGSASVTMSTWDNDNRLSGDGWIDDKSNDQHGQDAYVDGQNLGGKVYAESYHVLHGSDGKTYYMIEIEVEGHNAPGAGDDYFTFYGAVPPAGVSLTVTQTCNVNGEWIDFACLGAGDSVPANTAPTFTNVPADGILYIDENTTFVIDLGASDADGDEVTFEITGGRDASFFEIDAHTGELSFVGAPDFENPQSGGNSNTYDVTVTITDGNGGSETKAMWVKVNDVDEDTGTGGECIVVEAEDMHLNGYKVEHNAGASGGEIIKGHINRWNSASTTFNGMGGEYDLKLTVLDENDGNSYIYVYVNGHDVSGLIRLAQDNGGAGGGNTFNGREITIENLNLQPGDEVKIWGYGEGNEYVRLDKIEFCKDGEVVEDASLGGTYFMDNNGNSVQDAGDMAVAGATVALLLNGQVIDTTTTDANGDYLFEGLAASDGYSVRFIDTGEGKTFVDGNVGGDDTIDSDVVSVGGSGNGNTGTISLAAGEDKRDVDGGIEDPGTASLAGRIFMDSDDDNQDNGEMGVGGVTVRLLDAAGNELATTTTANDGSYSFDNLDAGDYKVDFPTEVDGKVLVDANVGDDATDSDANTGNGETGVISLAIGENSVNNDAGIEDPGTASVGNLVFIDNNGNGVFDAGDGRAAGVVVELLDENGTVIDDTVTNNNGQYLFDGLDAGVYSVKFTAPEGLEFTTEGAATDDTRNNDSDADVVTGETSQFELSIDEAERQIDAGLVVSDTGDAEIAGRVFMDSDDDNQDNGEMGVGGVTVTLLNGDGSATGRTTTTADDGSYEFTGLNAGDYIVDFPTEVDGKVLVDSNVGNDATDSDADQGNGQTGVISLAIGERSEDNDAGIEDPAGSAIEGIVFMDNNDDSQSNAGDMGIGGVTVTLLNADGSPTGRTTTTASDGSYAFTGLVAGAYIVAFPTEVDGKVLVDSNVGPDTSDSDALANGQTGVINVGVNETSSFNDAGVEDPGTASLGDTLFLDRNGNGRQDAGEEGVDGVEVTLTDADGNTLTTTTANGGQYLFDGLDAGDYVVDFADVDGFDFTTQNAAGDAVDSDVDANGTTGPVSLSIGENNDTVDAGLVSEGPSANDDAAKTCANEEVAVDVLANDGPNAGTITQVGGQNIAEGQTVTVGGVEVTLSGGQLVFDGEVAYESLDIGETAVATISYTVADDFGGTTMADVDVTFCGTAETLQEICDSLPATASIQVINENNPIFTSDEAYTVKITSGDARIDGVYAEAYCVANFDWLRSSKAHCSAQSKAKSQPVRWKPLASTV